MKVGDIIRFRYTGVRAEITTDYMDGSFAVWLFDDREESIAFDDDIVLDSAFKGVEQSALSKERNKKKPKVEKKMSTEEMFFSKEELGGQKMGSLQKNKSIIQTNKKEEEEEEEVSDFKALVFQPQAATNTGLWLAFVETAEQQFTIYLVNDSLYSIRFEYNLQLLQMQKESLKQTINTNDYYPIGEFFYEELNDSPEIKISCPGLHLQEAFKLKFKNWMKMDGAVPLIGIETKCRLLFSTQRIEKAQQLGNQSKDIQTYTHEQVTEKVKKLVISRFYNKNDLQRLAHFEKEIDLHIEQLVDETKTLTPSEIYDIQHLALEKYMMQAIELEVKEVYIIHGIGEGKLQRSVATHLQDLQRRKLIKEFKNEYIEGYGFGATWVKV
jgi:hypothetical protein